MDIVLNRERFRRLIDDLQAAYEIGYSLESSQSFPAEPLLELMIDASLRLREQALNEGPWTEISNPSLEFLEKPLKLRSGARSGIWATEPDELGNVRNKRTGPAPETVTDPKLPKFYKELADLLVEVKLHHHLPQHLYCEERSGRRSQPSKKITPETFWYLKRRGDRLRKHNTHQNRKG